MTSRKYARIKRLGCRDHDWKRQNIWLGKLAMLGKTDIAKRDTEKAVSAHCDSCWESELVTAFLTCRIIVDSIRVNIVRSALNILGGMRMGD